MKHRTARISRESGSVLLTVLFCIAASSLELSAQPKFDGRIGLSFPWAIERVEYESGHYSTHYRSITRMYIGASAEFELSDAVSFCSELSYAGMGYGYPRDEDLDAYEYFEDVHLDYLTLPISLKYKANSWVSLLAGGYASFLISEKGGIINYGLSLPIKERNDFDCGILMGLESLVYKNFGLGARATWGLLTFDQDSEDEYKYNRGIQLYTFYRWH